MPQVSILRPRIFSSGICELWNAEELLGLQAQSPPRMIEAIAQRKLGVDRAAVPVHRLQEEVLEG
jgi:hypothetical protein